MHTPADSVLQCLTAQLRPLQAERPELEGQRQALLQSEQALRVQLVALEKQLLEALASSRWEEAEGVAGSGWAADAAA
jgi:hypothetical protein